MKRIFTILLVLAVFCSSAQEKVVHYLKITLDTKLMAPDYGLGGGGGFASICTKVYAHLGLCTCNLITTTLARDCFAPSANASFCAAQIQPYRSNVWQHVVGNWGSNPADDGVGLMTTLGNGVYSIEFNIEDYFSNPALVNTEAFSDNDPATPDPVASTVWNPSMGGLPYTIGMVFRNEDGSKTGRDDLGSDLFIVNMTTTPQVIQGSASGTPFPAITFVTGVFVEKLNDNSIHYLSVFPNPVINQAQIVYSLTGLKNNVSIRVFNLLGQEVSTLLNGNKSSGSYSINWDGKDNSGKKLSSGIYYVILHSNGKMIEKQKIVIE